MRLGLLGGTFDPIHYGHLLLAAECRQSLALDKVLFIPAGQPWLKAGQPLTPGIHRRRMVELAIADHPPFALWDGELRRPGPTYTVDTLTQLQSELPDVADFYFILGLDALESFPRWKDPERILQLVKLAVAARPGYTAAAGNDIIQKLKSRYPEHADRITLMTLPGAEISATAIRRRAAAGRSFRYHTPEPVAQYILEHGIYQEQSP